MLVCRFCEEVYDQGAVADRGEDVYELYLVSRIPELKLNSRMYLVPNIEEFFEGLSTMGP